MVRINLISAGLLTDQHLAAERVEIMMLLTYITNYPKLDDKSIPKKYTLGKGHMKFFKDKVIYLVNRFDQITEEMKNRGMKPVKQLEIQNLIPKQNFNDYEPSPEAISMVCSRILERISQKPGWYRYYGKQKPLEFYQDLLLFNE